MTDRPIEELQAGDAFRLSLVERADARTIIGNAPLWYGWAIMDAFLAGIDYARVDGQHEYGGPSKHELIAERGRLRELLTAARALLQHHKAEYPDEIDDALTDGQQVKDAAKT